MGTPTDEGQYQKIKEAYLAKQAKLKAEREVEAKRKAEWDALIAKSQNHTGARRSRGNIGVRVRTRFD